MARQAPRAAPRTAPVRWERSAAPHAPFPRRAPSWLRAARRAPRAARRACAPLSPPCSALITRRPPRLAPPPSAGRTAPRLRPLTADYAPRAAPRRASDAPPPHPADYVPASDAAARRPRPSLRPQFISLPTQNVDLRHFITQSKQFKTHFKWYLSLFKRFVEPCHGTVMSRAGSINPLLSSSHNQA